MRHEKEDEHDFGTFIRDEGGLYLKFTSPGTRGVMDRMFVGPKQEECMTCGRSDLIGFIEWKQQHRYPSKLQYHWIEEFSKRGVPVSWFDDKKKALDWYYDLLRSRQSTG